MNRTLAEIQTDVLDLEAKLTRILDDAYALSNQLNEALTERDEYLQAQSDRLDALRRRAVSFLPSKPRKSNGTNNKPTE